ncbi:MAG TPA: hypothetical protein VMX36_04995 [Sedimentisphaerales bacterium]|nr:hypothetical protein [Sedimentisphaerales bacterium]
MDKSVSHDRNEESAEAKVRWFRSLAMSERMEMLCSFTDLALTANPGLQEYKHAQPVTGRIQVLDLEDVRLLELTEDLDKTN